MDTAECQRPAQYAGARHLDLSFADAEGIAMGLVRRGPNGWARCWPSVPAAGDAARISDPVFYDKEGKKQNV